MSDLFDSADVAIAVLDSETERAIDEAIGIVAVTIRLHQSTINDLKYIADDFGVTYKTLMRSVLVDYATAEAKKLRFMKRIESIEREISKKRIVKKVSKQEKCFDCDEEAIWVNHTQFAGSHYYCDEHARQQSDFDEMVGI
jgi:hypothetical protein